MTSTHLDLADLVVLGEAVVVEASEDERLVEGLAVGHPLEGERLVEERVQRLAVNLGLELALLVRHQVDLLECWRKQPSDGQKSQDDDE